jgi:hypothetical protein
MSNMKHVGRFLTNGRKCLVAYRTLPGDAYNCLVIPTEAVEDSYHDALINLVESNAAQSSYEFAEILARNTFPDGSVMLASLHKLGKLIKVATDQIEMIPNTQQKIRLDELNLMIAEQRGIAVDDLALNDPNAVPRKDVEVQEIAKVQEILPPIEPIEQKTLSIEEQATRLRGQADKLSKEAAALRRQAEDLVPTKKNVRTKTK